MKSLTPALVLCALLFPSVAQADAGSTMANPAIDMQGHLRIASAAAAHRDARRLSEAEFLRMSREPGMIVLDARLDLERSVLRFESTARKAGLR